MTVSQRDAQVQAALNEGNRAWQENRTEDAARHFAEVARLAPGIHHGHMNLAVALRRLGKVPAAIASGRRALALRPNDPVLHSNLGNALREAGMLEEAEHHHRFAHQAVPDNPSFAFNLALLLRDRRKHDEARAMMARLVASHPDHPEYAWDLALTDLYGKDYVQGFAGYEARMGLARFHTAPLPGKRWMPGQDIAGKVLLVAAEQGFGDALQFARFLPMLRDMGAQVVVQCLPELTELLNSPPHITTVAKHAPLPPHDLWIPVMSLASMLGITWDNLPNQVPYLSSGRPPSPLDLPPGAKLRVGLIWAGKTTPRDRSWPLRELLPLFEDPRLAFFSLQMGPRRDDLAELGLSHLVTDLSPRLDSFAASAAAMEQLDLIVTIDTSGAHLAGALGRPTLVLLRYVSDWRWLYDGEDCAWYPTLRLFRQDHPEDFTGPVRKVKAALAEMLG